MTKGLSMNTSLFANRFMAGALLCVLLGASLLAAAGPAQQGHEPTNAAEAAARKAAADKAIDEQFQQWKAALPAPQQAWERTLEANLGSFYLPLYKRDKVAGRVTAWDYLIDDPKLPRVLLIGDSVSRGYTLAVRKALAGKANVHRAPENCGPTANGLKKLDVWLGDGKWDLIHFNFGIHDRRTSPALYEQRLEAIIERLQHSGAKLVWASTTPVPPDTKDGPAAAAAIVERNVIAARVMQKHGIAIDDLFTIVTPHLAKVQNPKDVHFNAEGYELLGRQVATSIEAALHGRAGGNK
jgi:lysophospholipase L1-like esterase